MRVLITGGTGLVGRPISERFVSLGWDARVIGVEAECALSGVHYVQCDIRDVESLAEQVADRDAIVHLAAIPSTRTHPNETLFEINVAGTYNVFEAAARAGVKRIVQASSINAIGGYWGNDDRQYAYFPFDEDLPLHTTDAYSLSKELVEEIAAYYWRRAGISSVSFRLPAVWNDAVIESRNLRDNLRERVRQLDAFRRLPVERQQARLARAREQALALRARQVMEYEALQRGDFEREAPQDDWLFGAWFYDRFNFWTFIHTDDSTQAFERAVRADYQGAHPLFVNSDLNSLQYNTEALLSLFYPQVSRRSKALAGAESPVSIARARDLIGFEPMVRTIFGDMKSLTTEGTEDTQRAQSKSVLKCSGSESEFGGHSG